MEGDMDKSALPCNDFFRYACGNYIKRYLRGGSRVVLKNKFLTLSTQNVLDAKKALDGMSSTTDPIFKKAYQYYDTCMKNSRSMSVYWQAVSQIGSSPVTDGSFNLQSWDANSALQSMKKFHDTNPLFTVGVGSDLFDSSQNIIRIRPPDTALLSKVSLENHMEGKPPKYPGFVLEDDIDEIQQLVSKFKNNVRSTFESAASAHTGKSADYIYSRLSDGLQVEADLINDVRATMTGMRLDKVYQRLTVANLTIITGGQIDWLKLLGGIFSGQSTATITNSTLVGMMIPVAYLKRIVKYFPSKDPYGLYSLPSYFAWTLLKKFSPVLPDTYFAAYYFGSKASDINSVGKEKWRACMLDTEVRMPLSIGMMFTKRVINKNIFNKTNVLLVEVRKAFHDGIDKVPWLDSPTRAAVKMKLKYLLGIIANPDMMNSTSLLARYINVRTRTDNLGDFFLSCVKNLVDNNLQLLHQPPSRIRIDDITASKKLYEVNAFYMAIKNRIMILAGILRSPFIYESGPWYINFGKIASILGHEILHGFDSTGLYYDKTGQIKPWWTAAASREFDVRKACIKSQYDGYKYGSKYINGTLTLGENIADHGGLKYAYLAYKSWAKKYPNEKKPDDLKSLNHDQLFFLSYAQMWCQAVSSNVKPYLLAGPHSPNKYRVIGSLSNFLPFAKAYGCGLGSPMNRRVKCPLW
eukprot:gene7522-8355_t